MFIIGDQTFLPVDFTYILVPLDDKYLAEKGIINILFSLDAKQLASLNGFPIEMLIIYRVWFLKYIKYMHLLFEKFLETCPQFLGDKSVPVLRPLDKSICLPSNLYWVALAELPSTIL